MSQYSLKRGAVTACCVLGIVIAFLFVGQSYADSGLITHDTIRIGLYYGSQSLPSARVSCNGEVQFFVQTPLGQDIPLLKGAASVWDIHREAIRLEFGPYGSVSGAHQVLNRWPQSITPAFIVQEPDGYYVIGGSFFSVEQAWMSIPTLTSAGLAGGRVRGAQHLVTAPLGKEEAHVLRDRLFLAGIRSSVYYDGHWRVIAGTETDTQGINNLRQKITSLIQEVVWQTLMPTFRRVEVFGSNGQLLFTYADLVGMPLSVKPVSDNGIMSVQGKQHRGIYEFMLDTENRFVVVSIMDVEDYLKGVVPREMPALWHLEAVKAQAVVARTYAQANRGKHAHHGFDLCTFSTCCQAYGGVEWEQANSNQAIDETQGEVLFFNGRPALTFYHSDSGGHTEGNNNVWNGSPIPYLGGVPDPYGALAGSTQSAWSVSLSQEEMQRIVAHNGTEVGTIVRLEVAERTAAGRALTVLVHGTRGVAELIKQQPRLPNGTPGVFALRSTMYEVENRVPEGIHVTNGNTTQALTTWQDIAVMTADGVKPLPAAGNYVLQGNLVSRTVSAIPNSFLFEGSGWGHGVGLSQWGARGMAEQGHSYAQILLHYYQGVHIVDVMP